MIKILICEDDLKDRKILIEYLQSYFKKNKIDIEINILNNYESSDYYEEYDFIFLDIQLENTNGIDFARRFREKNRDSIIVITSNYQKYLIEGYTIEAQRYFLKPIEKEIFEEEMDKLLFRYKDRLSGFYDEKLSRKRIYYKDILYIEFLDRHSVLSFTNGNKIHTKYTLKYWMEKMEGYTFCQSYKSFYVNLDYVTGFSKDWKDIFISNGEIIPLSKKYKKEFTNEYFIHLHKSL